MFDDELWLGERKIPLTVEAWAIRTPAEREQAQRALGLAPQATQFTLDCRRDIDPRPYFVGDAADAEV